MSDSVKGLSATNIVRLKAKWEEEYLEWNRRDLSQKAYVYFWADGIYFNVRLDDDRSCILVIAADEEETRSCYRSLTDIGKQLSWREMLLDLKRRV